MSTQAVAAEVEVTEHKGMSPVVEATVSWGTSGLLHVGVALLALASMYAVGKASNSRPQPPLVVDGSGTAEGIHNPFFGRGNDPSEARQPWEKITPPNGHDTLGKFDGMIDQLSGAKGDELSTLIALNTGAGSPKGHGDSNLGTGVGRLAPYGALSHGSFFGTPLKTGGRPPKRVVFVLDHSGSMLDTFDFLRMEVKRAMKSFTPMQEFAVIMFAESVTSVGGEGLHRGLGDTKRDVGAALDQLRAQGENDDQLEPFKKGLERAFALKPEVVVFLTDGKFDERLPSVVAGLNRDHKVVVNTIAFCRIEKSSEQQLIEIAQKNGGKYKFVSEKDLGH